MTPPAPETPRVVVVTLGGTIASRGAAGHPVEPALAGGEFLAGLGALAGVEVALHDRRTVPSVEVTLEDLAAAADLIAAERAAGAVGAVVVQGTDTLEESAAALDLLGGAGPIVVTGAMRPPSSPGADGPANLVAALRVAAAPAAQGLGALVVLGDDIHAARFVRKAHSARPAAFASPTLGPIGEVVEGRVALHARLAPLPPVAARPPFPAVALVPVVHDDDGRLVGALGGLGHAGVVVEAPGGGHVPAALAAPLGDLAARVPVVLASRTGAGPVLRETYGYPGGEVDLRARGLIGAGPLDARHARVALRLLLSAGASRADVAAWFGALDAL